MSTQIERMKKFISEHKLAIGVAATTAVMFAIHRMAVKQWDEFLKEHDLFDEYYRPEE